MYDVITLGSGTVDVFVNTDVELMSKKRGKLNTKMMAYPLGSKILIKDIKHEVGGGGTNTAVAFSRFGLKTGWVGKVGNDEHASHILEYLREENIDFLGTRSKKGDSGYSVILDSMAHDRTILTFKGENDNLGYEEIKKSSMKTRWFYFCSMIGKSFSTQKKISTYAKKNNIKIAYNPSSYQAKQGIKNIGPILKNTTVLIMNREEAGYLVGEGSTQDMCRRLYKTGPDIIIITNGSDGAICYNGTDMIHVKSHKIKVLETTGAGDAFASSFIGALIKTNDIKKSLKIALTNAQSVIQHFGAKNILLDWNKVVKKEKSKPVRLVIE